MKHELATSLAFPEYFFRPNFRCVKRIASSVPKGCKDNGMLITCTLSGLSKRYAISHIAYINFYKTTGQFKICTR